VNDRCYSIRHRTLYEYEGEVVHAHQLLQRSEAKALGVAMLGSKGASPIDESVPHGFPGVGLFGVDLGFLQPASVETSDGKQGAA
jgi:hypothetical protein